MKTVFFYILWALVSASAFFKTQQDDENVLSSCVEKIVEDFDYKKYYHLMDITVMNMNNDLNLSALHNIEGTRFVSRRFFWDPGNIYNKFYIVVCEDYQELEHGLSKVISDKFWNPKAMFIIILKSYRNYNLSDITNLLHAYNILHEVSLISRDGEDYAIYKYNFTKPGYCFKSGHLTFWSWCSDYRTQKKLPVLYEGSIRKCEFKFITRNLWPFMNFDTSTQGTEQHFITLFEKQFEIRIDLHEFGKVDKYGKLMNNLTQIMVQKVANNKFEGVVGGYAIANETDFGNVSYSYPTLIDYMRYIIAHSNYVEQWVAVLYQSSETCIVVCLLFVVFSVLATCLSIFRTRKDVSYNILVIFGYLLNKHSVRRTVSGWPQTLIFSSLLFTSFIIPYAIQANLFSVTTQPVRAYEPKEPEDLRNHHAALFTELWRRSEFGRYRDCGTRFNCLMQVKNDPHKSLYTIISDSHFKVYQWQFTDDQCKMAIYRLKEPLNSIYRTIYLRRGSVLIPHLDHFTLQFLSTGVMEKYANDINIREWLKCKSRYRPEHVPLPLANFYYVFMILSGGYCLSILMFVYEVWAGSQRNLRGNIE